MPKSKRPRTPSLKSKLVKDLRTKLKSLNNQIRQHKRDLRSLGVGRKKNVK